VTGERRNRYGVAQTLVCGFPSLLGNADGWAMFDSRATVSMLVAETHRLKSVLLKQIPDVALRWSELFPFNF
jgi:hypothetical protein